MRWCIHHSVDDNGDHLFKGDSVWAGPFKDDGTKFCPICGTPRPTPQKSHMVWPPPPKRTLAEEIQNYLISKNVGLVQFGLSASCPQEDFAGDMAKIAEEHFKNNHIA